MRRHLSLAVLAALFAASAVWASSGGFEITAAGITLGKMEEVTEKDKPQPPRIKAKAEVGKPFTLVAQGKAYGRGDPKGAPFAPEAGAWAFDKKHFEQLKQDEKAADKTKVAVTLKPTAAGTMRVRFTGKVLGYERTYDVVIEVAEAKK